MPISKFDSRAILSELLGRRRKQGGPAASVRMELEDQLKAAHMDIAPVVASQAKEIQEMLKGSDLNKDDKAARENGVGEEFRRHLAYHLRATAHSRMSAMIASASTRTPGAAVQSVLRQYLYAAAMDTILHLSHSAEGTHGAHPITDPKTPLSESLAALPRHAQKQLGQALSYLTGQASGLTDNDPASTSLESFLLATRDRTVRFQNEHTLISDPFCQPLREAVDNHKTLLAAQAQAQSPHPSSRAAASTP